MLCILLRLRVKPGKMDELKEFLAWDADHAREHEPETLRFDVLPGDEDGTLFLYEAYQSPEAFEFHKSQPPYQKFESGIMQECIEGMDVLAGGVSPETSNALPTA